MSEALGGTYSPAASRNLRQRSLMRPFFGTAMRSRSADRSHPFVETLLRAVLRALVPALLRSAAEGRRVERGKESRVPEAGQDQREGE